GNVNVGDGNNNGGGDQGNDEDIDIEGISDDEGDDGLGQVVDPSDRSDDDT
ncbi:hypothetical protein A2U01_0103696, partial [Trifolium medium]|nr:hypothetical protein [Trifolium medium]